MFQFFKRKPGKCESVTPRTSGEQELRKDVVNLLIPNTEYHQKSGVGALMKIMAGKKRRGKRKRAESCRTSPPKEQLQRSSSVNTPASDENSPTSQAEFVKALVLEKYAKPPTNNEHVSLVYVSDEKKHAEALLREIAKSIDCAVDEINEMGTGDSKNKEPYENVNKNHYRNDIKEELDRIEANKVKEEEERVRKSNLKLPKTEDGLSDDDRSDSGKKKVTFQKHIVFDDGEQQTDDENSFESLTSEDELEYLDDESADNKTVININENESIKIKIEDVDRKMCSDNSDSGFLDIGDRNVGDRDSVKSEVSGSETEEEIIEEIIEEEISFVEDFEEGDDEKSLVSQENKFHTQVAAITELGEARCESTERTRDLIAAYRKEIEAKDQEIEQLKCELAAAYKESELIRQRSRSLEDELSAARRCSADLADQLHRKNEECMRELKSEIEQATARRNELEARVVALERDKDRLEQEKIASEQKAQQALQTAEANTAKWRLAHESARSQAAARAERMLADCEWKMREIEKKAREAEKENKQLKETVEKLQSDPPIPQSHIAELQQLRGLASEQQRSVQCLTLELQKVETREEALKLEVHRLKELLEREERKGKEMQEKHLQKIQTLRDSNMQALESLRSEMTSSAAAARATLERAHAERTRAALAQLREESEQQARNADRKLREVTTRFENLKEELATKEAQYEAAIAQAHSKADWDILQLRHLLDKADIDYANNVENLNRKFEEEKENLIAEWEAKLKEAEEQAASDADEAKKLLEATRLKLIAERLEQVNKLKEQHRQEMEDQWEQFMSDKESCLSRMKTECRQEGEEERIKRERELLEEIAELKSQVHSKSTDFENLAVKAAACGRTLAVTEQELREALAREKELREKRSDDATKLRQLEKNSKEQIEHLTRKCACIRKLFDDMRARLSAKERAAEQEARARDKELHQLRGEVARLTKILVEQSSPKLGARTRADGCEMTHLAEAKSEPRRKGSLRTPELVRKATCPLPLDLAPTKQNGGQDGRPRAKSVDLPAVQVPVIVKQLERKKK